MDLNLLKDQCLVPGWTQRLLQLLCGLTLVDKYGPSEGVGESVAVSGQQIAGLVDIGA